jgi:hypothetical protein
LEKAFDGAIRPVRRTLTYRFAVLMSLGVMLLTPLVYLAIIGATGFAVYYHAVNHTGILTAVRGRGVVLAAIAYTAPLVVGPILIFFMFKPFFSRPRREERRRSLVRQNEPLLFEFVDKVCDAVRAPRPKRIDVDCQLNASASFRRGFLSFLGSDLVLTIGMPLVAGLSLREFGGVLAHEFGHFSQGAGMRLTYVLRSVSNWLARSVYQRDNWDEWLESTAQSVDLRVGWVLLLAQGMVWATRRILALLLHLSMAISGYALRQMEYDADRYEARFAGSDAFESTTRKMGYLGAALQTAYNQLGRMQREGALVDDLPRLVVLNETRFEPNFKRGIDEQITKATTGWFDTHPASRDRIRNAHAEQAEGVFRLDRPASDLFRDFDAQSRAATWELYRDALGEHVDRASLRPVAQVDGAHAKEQEQTTALVRYSQKLWRPTRRIGLTRDCIEPTTNAKESAAELRTLRGAFEESLAEQKDLLRQWSQLRERSGQARTYQALHRSGVVFKKGTTDAAFASADACAQTLSKSEVAAARLGNRLESHDLRLAHGLRAALRLAANDAIAKQLKDGSAMQQKLRAIVPALIAIDGQIETLNSLRDDSQIADSLVTAIQRSGATEELVGQLFATARRTHPRLTQVRDVLAVAAWPYREDRSEMTLGSYLVPAAPSAEELGPFVSALSDSLDRALDAQVRLMSDLCTIAETVESALKLPRLPEPSSSDE